MAARDIIQAAGGSAATSAAVYVEDVFSTYLYTGNGSTQTINNGIDLATKGGMVWTKLRSTNFPHAITDTARGGNSILQTNATDAAQSASGAMTFNTNGYTFDGGWSYFGYSGQTFASWTFAKQPKFFDVVTYTGDGFGRGIPHNLGCVPGMIIVKRVDATSDWRIYHKGLTSASYSIKLNTNEGQAVDTQAWGAAPDADYFNVGSVNCASGATYVAYLFADSNSGGFGPAGTDSVVACGNFTTSGETTVNLGWEPQFVLVKRVDNTQSWYLLDNMRGMSVSGPNNYIHPNLSDAEVSATGYFIVKPTATGFTAQSMWFGNASNFIYLAIRRGPMRTPTDATKVFAPVVSGSSSGTVVTTGFPVDTQMLRFGHSDYSGFDFNFIDRLRGVNTTSSSASGPPVLQSSSTGAENTTLNITSGWGSLGFNIPVYSAGVSSLYYSFRRAPGFFDVVCYTGTGSATTVAHNLGVAPELLITKSRSTGYSWIIYSASLGNSSYMDYTNEPKDPYGSLTLWNNTTPTSTNFSVSSTANVENVTYVAYLFASCPGVSKVFSFTGNGSSQTIDCGFTSGARFVLIKRTDSTGDWWVYDSARGIVSAADPALRLNSTAAEVTSADAVDPASSGFIVNQEATCNVNVNNATYIGLAIA